MIFLVATLIILLLAAVGFSSYLYGKLQGFSKLVIREERLIRRLTRDLYKWQNAVTVKQGMSPVNSPQVPNARPVPVQLLQRGGFFRQAEQQWDEEDEAEFKRKQDDWFSAPELSEEKRAELIDAARKATA